MSSDQVKAILDAAESQHQQSDIWSVCLNTVMVEEQQTSLDSLTTATKCFNIDDLKKGQQSEHWIVRVKNIVKKNVFLTPAEKKKEPPHVQRLLSDEGNNQGSQLLTMTCCEEKVMTTIRSFYLAGLTRQCTKNCTRTWDTLMQTGLCS